MTIRGPGASAAEKASRIKTVGTMTIMWQRFIVTIQVRMRPMVRAGPWRRSTLVQDSPKGAPWGVSAAMTRWCCRR
ncbi:hypothetical protein N602_25535 [Mycobacterium avium subsp. hominissuis 10-5606]|nr:hypothetical protein N602_25535 [Mycobacterium avium subsp. hominissuis 10-5606]